MNILHFRGSQGKKHPLLRKNKASGSITTSNLCSCNQKSLSAADSNNQVLISFLLDKSLK